MIYVPLFRRLFPTANTFPTLTLREKFANKQGMKETGAQVVIDQFLHHPLMYFPVFYATKEIVTNPTNPDLKKAIITDYFGTNFKEDMIALWKIWIPSTVINFAFMPLWGRIPWVASTSLIWTCVLSMMRGSDAPVSEGEVIGPGVTGDSYSLFSGAYKSRMCPVEMDSHLSHITVSASGMDKIGMVARMCKGVADAGGNITMSKMTRLGNQFVMMMHVSYDHQKVRHLDLLESIRNNSEELTVKINNLQPRSTGNRAAPQMTFKVSCRGPDVPGFTAAVTSVLASHNVSIENLDTNVVLEADGRRSFWLDIEGSERKMALFTDEDVKALSEELKNIKGSDGMPLSRMTLKVAKKENGN